MRDDLEYELCLGCAEIKAHGIFWHITHCCPLNTVSYRPGSFRIRHLRQLFAGERDMDCFNELLKFDSFNAMPDYENSSILDKKIYRHIRDLDIRTMKRLRAHIELEEAFAAKY